MPVINNTPEIIPENNNPPVKIITCVYHGMTIEIPEDKFEDMTQIVKEFINVLSTITYTKLDKYYLQDYNGFNLNISIHSFRVVSDSIDKLLNGLKNINGKITYINSWDLQKVIISEEEEEQKE